MNSKNFEKKKWLQALSNQTQIYGVLLGFIVTGEVLLAIEFSNVDLDYSSVTKTIFVFALLNSVVNFSLLVRLVDLEREIAWIEKGERRVEGNEHLNNLRNKETCKREFFSWSLLINFILLVFLIGIMIW